MKTQTYGGSIIEIDPTGEILYAVKHECYECQDIKFFKTEEERSLFLKWNKAFGGTMYYDSYDYSVDKITKFSISEKDKIYFQ